MCDTPLVWDIGGYGQEIDAEGRDVGKDEIERAFEKFDEELARTKRLAEQLRKQNEDQQEQHPPEIRDWPPQPPAGASWSYNLREQGFDSPGAAS